MDAFIWANYGVKKGDYNELTKKIWVISMGKS